MLSSVCFWYQQRARQSNKKTNWRQLYEAQPLQRKRAMFCIYDFEMSLYTESHKSCYVVTLQVYTTLFATQSIVVHWWSQCHNCRWVGGSTPSYLTDPQLSHRNIPRGSVPTPLHPVQLGSSFSLTGTYPYYSTQFDYPSESSKLLKLLSMVTFYYRATRICIARTMPWQDVCPSVRPSQPVLCVNG